MTGNRESGLGLVPLRLLVQGAEASRKSYTTQGSGRKRQVRGKGGTAAGGMLFREQEGEIGGRHGFEAIVMVRAHPGSLGVSADPGCDLPSLSEL